MEELSAAGGVVVGGVAVPGHHPLGRQQTFNSDRAPGVNATSRDANFGTCNLKVVKLGFLFHNQSIN